MRKMQKKNHYWLPSKANIHWFSHLNTWLSLYAPLLNMQICKFHTEHCLTVRICFLCDCSQGTWSASEVLACSLMSSGRSCWGYLKGYFSQLFTRSCWEPVQLRWQKGHVCASGLLPFLAWIVKLDHHWWSDILKYWSESCNSWEVKFSQPLWNRSDVEIVVPNYVS